MTNTDKSEFTEHASDHILQRASPFVDRHINDSNRQLLNKLNINGYKKIVGLVKSTFPTVSTAMIDQWPYNAVLAT